MFDNMSAAFLEDTSILCTTSLVLLTEVEDNIQANNTSNKICILFRQTDEQLGFDAAVAALGLKANVCEADHPLLCEGTRRQRGDLALLLLVHYKDQPERLCKVMEKILDKVMMMTHLFVGQQGTYFFVLA